MSIKVSKEHALLYLKNVSLSYWDYIHQNLADQINVLKYLERVDIEPSLREATEEDFDQLQEQLLMLLENYNKFSCLLTNPP